MNVYLASNLREEQPLESNRLYVAALSITSCLTVGKG